MENFDSDSISDLFEDEENLEAEEDYGDVFESEDEEQNFEDEQRFVDFGVEEILEEVDLTGAKKAIAKRLKMPLKTKKLAFVKITEDGEEIAKGDKYSRGESKIVKKYKHEKVSGRLANLSQSGLDIVYETEKGKKYKTNFMDQTSKPRKINIDERLEKKTDKEGAKLANLEQGFSGYNYPTASSPLRIKRKELITSKLLKKENGEEIKVAIGDTVKVKIDQSKGVIYSSFGNSLKFLTVTGNKSTILYSDISNIESLYILPRSETYYSSGNTRVYIDYFRLPKWNKLKFRSGQFVKLNLSEPNIEVEGVVESFSNTHFRINIGMEVLNIPHNRLIDAKSSRRFLIDKVDRTIKDVKEKTVTNKTRNDIIVSLFNILKDVFGDLETNKKNAYKPKPSPIISYEEYYTSQFRAWNRSRYEPAIIAKINEPQIRDEIWKQAQHTAAKNNETHYMIHKFNETYLLRIPINLILKTMTFDGEYLKTETEILKILDQKNWIDEYYNLPNEIRDTRIKNMKEALKTSVSLEDICIELNKTPDTEIMKIKVLGLCQQINNKNNIRGVELYKLLYNTFLEINPVNPVNIYNDYMSELAESEFNKIPVTEEDRQLFEKENLETIKKLYNEIFSQYKKSLEEYKYSLKIPENYNQEGELLYLNSKGISIWFELKEYEESIYNSLEEASILNLGNYVESIFFPFYFIKPDIKVSKYAKFLHAKLLSRKYQISALNRANLIYLLPEYAIRLMKELSIPKLFDEKTDKYVENWHQEFLNLIMNDYNNFIQRILSTFSTKKVNFQPQVDIDFEEYLVSDVREICGPEFRNIDLADLKICYDRENDTFVCQKMEE